MQYVQNFNLSSCFYNPSAFPLSFNRVAAILENQEFFYRSPGVPCRALVRSVFSALCHQCCLIRQNSSSQMLFAIVFFLVPFLFVGLCSSKCYLYDHLVWSGEGKGKHNVYVVSVLYF